MSMILSWSKVYVENIEDASSVSWTELPLGVFDRILGLGACFDSSMMKQAVVLMVTFEIIESMGYSSGVLIKSPGSALRQ